MGLKGIRRVTAVIVALAAGLILFQGPSFASDQARAKELLQQTCVQCHRLEGTAESRFKLHAPDLIWAGSK